MHSLFHNGVFFWLFLFSLVSRAGADRGVSSDCTCGELWKRPELWKKALTARWMVHSLDWGVLSTLSGRTGVAMPFGNVYSFVDGSCANATGTPYFYGTFMDQSFQDAAKNPAASLTLSEAATPYHCLPSDDDVRTACTIVRAASGRTGDPENPVCARLTLSGTLVEVPPGGNGEEFASVKRAFYERHPQMRLWPEDHDWVIAKLVITDVWLIDYFGGGTVLTPDEYYAAKLTPPGKENSN